MQVSGPVKEDTVPCKKSPRWSAGRRACSIARARGRLTRCPMLLSAVPALSPLILEGEEVQGDCAAPALKGPMAHACRAVPNAPIVRFKKNLSAGAVNLRRSITMSAEHDERAAEFSVSTFNTEFTP